MSVGLISLRRETLGQVQAGAQHQLSIIFQDEHLARNQLESHASPETQTTVRSASRCERVEF